MTERPPLDPAVVGGLIEEHGASALSRTYDHRWERDVAAWRAVLQALEDASEGRTPTTRRAGPPEWLSPLVRRELQAMATRWSHDFAFNAIRALELAGLVTLEPDDTYVLAAIGGIGDRFAHSRATALRADPDLINRVVWRMFEVEGGGEVSLANFDKYRGEDVGWQSTFIELTSDGTLPRERVLTSALHALNRDFSAYRAGWYSRLYVALDPTVDEIARHQAQLRTLLRSTIPATVSFALVKLRLLSKRGDLDGPRTMPALRPAALAGPKTTARSAIRLVEEIVNHWPQLAEEAINVAAAVLDHPHADVQAAAGTLLGKLGATDRLEEVIEFLEPSVRADLLGHHSAPDVDTDDLHPAGDTRTEPAVAMPVPPHGDDLIDRLAALLEDASDPIEVESVLAGLVAMESPERLRSLTKRAATIHRRGPREGVTSLWLRGQLARLVLAAAGSERPPSPASGDHTMAFLLRRLGVVEAVLRRERPPHLAVATPDDSHGWLSPAALVERLHRLTHPPDAHDLIAALLRIHPDQRAAALLQAQQDRGQLSGLIAEVVRYTFGAPPPATGRRRLLPGKKLDDVGIWVAASRTRLPITRDDWLAAQGVEGEGRSAPINASVVFKSHPYTWTESGRTHESAYWKWTIQVATEARTADDLQPTAVTGGLYEPAGHEHEDFVAWLAMIWPHDCEHFLVTGIHSVLHAATSTEVSHDAVRVLSALGRHPGRIGSLSRTCLAAGLTASRADQRAVAVDAILGLSRAGRLNAGDLATGLVSIRGPASLTRVAQALRDVAADDRQARNLVIDTLAAALPAFACNTRGMHALLELMREELLREARPLPTNARPWLAQIRGGSRAAKAAAALLAATMP